MLQINEAIIVEGKYDKIKLSSLVNTLIIEVNGFGIFKDKEKAELIKLLAATRGIIIMTDSDSAGNIIRNRINSLIKNGKVYNAYVPEILGKEKRKSAPSSEGILGVEGVDKNYIIAALNRCGINEAKRDKSFKQIENSDLFSLGITGGSNSSILRKKLLKTLNLPTNLSKNNLLKFLQYQMDINELTNIINTIKGE